MSDFSNAFPEGSPGGVGGAGTDLTKTLTANTVKINSSTGADVTIAAANSSNAGVMTSTHHDKLDGIEASADVTDAGNVGSTIHGAAAKTTPVDGDTVPLIDSAASNVLKKVTWANIKATLKTYFDTLYSTFTNPMSASGDIIYGGAAGVGTRLAKGSNGQVLTLASGLPSWATPSAGGTISTPKVFYVETVANGGNDATGAVGDPSKPYASGTAAYNAGNAAFSPFVIKFGADSHEIAITTDTSAYFKQAIGVGQDLTTLSITGTPASGLTGTNGYNTTLNIQNLDLTITANGGAATDTLQDGGSCGLHTIEGSNSKLSVFSQGGSSADTNGGGGGTVRPSGQIRVIQINLSGGSGGISGVSGANGNIDAADGCNFVGCTYTGVTNNGFWARCSYTAADITPTSTPACAAY